MRKVGAFTVEISGEVDDRYAKGTSKDASLSSQTETEFDAILYEDARVLAERICDKVHQKTSRHCWRVLLKQTLESPVDDGSEFDHEAYLEYTVKLISLRFL